MTSDESARKTFHYFLRSLFFSLTKKSEEGEAAARYVCILLTLGGLSRRRLPCGRHHEAKTPSGSRAALDLHPEVQRKRGCRGLHHRNLLSEKRKKKKKRKILFGRPELSVFHERE